MRIDLHTHSTASDGTTPPDQLMRDAAAAGLDVIALTDHDNTAGWKPAAAALPPGLTLVRGLELSCSWPPTVSRPLNVHLLAYLFDPAEPEFQRVRARIRRSRLERGQRIVELLRADGIDVTWSEVLAVADGAPVGRPHVAQILLRRGLVASMSAAFERGWLGGRYRVPKENVQLSEAIRLVRGAGGVPVLAHPRATSRGRVIPDADILELAKQGLAGLEADHADHAPAQREQVRALAGRGGLFVTGSSDFHGWHKTIELGENATTTDEVYQQIVTMATGCAPLTG